MARRQRIINKRLLRELSQEPCYICFADPPSDPHHVKSKGSGGNDVPENLISLCRTCHAEIHLKGNSLFADRHPMFKVWLRKMGWDSYEELGKRIWRRNQEADEEPRD